MRRLLLIIGALAVFSPPTVWGQGYPPPKGIPFRIDPSIDVSERAGWHLNIANGAFDRGELATDIGGASNLGIFGHTPNYADLKNITATYHTHPTATGTQWEDLLGAWHIQGSMAGIDFQMTIPWNNPPPPSGVADCRDPPGESFHRSNRRPSVRPDADCDCDGTADPPPQRQLRSGLADRPPGRMDGPIKHLASEWGQPSRRHNR